jgi:Flp pilus assembly protein TadD
MTVFHAASLAAVLAASAARADDPAPLQTTFTTNTRDAKTDTDYAANGRSADACRRDLPSLRAAVQAKPDDHAALRSYGECAGALGVTGDSEAFLQSLTDAKLGGANTLRLLAMLSLTDKKFDAAISAAKKLRALTPGDFRADEILFSAYASTRDWKAALATARRAAKDSPSSALAWHLQSVADVALEDYAAGEKAARRATELDPKNAEAWTNLGTCRTRRGRFAEALPAYRRAAELAPDDAVIRCNLALGDVDVKDAAAARRELSDLDRLDPGCAQAVRARLTAPGTAAPAPSPR